MPNYNTYKRHNTIANDSLKNASLQNQLGAFAYGAQTATEGTTTLLKTRLLKLVIDNKGGQIIEALVKPYQNTMILYLYIIIKDKNASFNINFGTTDNRILNTKDLLFVPTLKLKMERIKYFL